ncbi:MAG: polyprenyl synthetase family protein, partial [Gammaproteobacteria bacterium]|nr:polyprenyl synthetase family protein [Gammaproteobacteria bacterium]
LCGAQTDAADDAACALEMIHAYSLVHDDLPAMDDDDTRRGRPACHIQFGEAAAILAGSALQALAFATLAESDLLEARKMKMLQILAVAVGSGGMVGGQALEMEGDGGGLTAAELETVQHKKTGALICASVQLGAAAAGCTDEKTLTALTHYGRHLGLAFQVVDDILDHAGAGETETANSVTVLGAACASEKARELRDQAVAALAGLGGNAQRLREIADFVAQREK